MDIKLEQQSGHQDPASLGLRWKKTVRGQRVVGSNHDIGCCIWYKKSGTNNAVVNFEDSTTKQICNTINCEQNEGT